MNARMPLCMAQALTQARLMQLLSYDQITGIFTRISRVSNGLKVGDVAGHQSCKGYIHIMVDGVSYKAHRLAWLYVYGEFPNAQVDHVNRIKNDNRINNLRVVTNKQNCENIGKHRDNTSGYRGVYWDKESGVYRSQITHNYKKINVGRFSSAKAAYEAYCKAAAQLHANSPYAGGEE